MLESLFSILDPLKLDIRNVMLYTVLSIGFAATNARGKTDWMVLVA